MKFFEVIGWGSAYRGAKRQFWPLASLGVMPFYTVMGPKKNRTLDTFHLKQGVARGNFEHNPTCQPNLTLHAGKNPALGGSALGAANFFVKARFRSEAS